MLAHDMCFYSDFQNSDAIIYVVDSADSERLGEARDELHNMLEDVSHQDGFEYHAVPTSEPYVNSSLTVVSHL
jgi:hypothetical protein